jgi:hypothetical protein
VRIWYFETVDADGNTSEAEGIGATAADAAFNSTDIFPGEMIVSAEPGKEIAR